MEVKAPDLLAIRLRGIRPGPIESSDTRTAVLSRLAAEWESYSGTADQRTYPGKLWRAENLVWQPPFLRFDLERHGATVNGSTRAAVHTWEVNVEEKNAAIVREGVRQLSEQQLRLDVRPLAQEVVAALSSGLDHLALRWSADRCSARFLVAEVIPTGFKETTAGRRKRLRAALTKSLEKTGWRMERRGSVTAFRRVG